MGHEKEVQIAEVERRSSLYRRKCDYQLTNGVVILTYDGIATGTTVIAAGRRMRKHTPDCLMIVVPIVASRTLEIIWQEEYAVKVIQSTGALNTIGQVENFQPASDEEVREILRRRHHKLFQNVPALKLSGPSKIYKEGWRSISRTLAHQ